MQWTPRHVSKVGSGAHVLLKLEAGLPREDIELILPAAPDQRPTSGLVLQPDGTPAASALLHARARDETGKGL